MRLPYGIVRSKHPKHPRRSGRRQGTWGQLRGKPAQLARLRYMADSFLDDRRRHASLLDSMGEWRRHMAMLRKAGDLRGEEFFRGHIRHLAELLPSARFPA